jgi:hypothetical protein
VESQPSVKTGLALHVDFVHGLALQADKVVVLSGVGQFTAVGLTRYFECVVRDRRRALGAGSMRSVRRMV